jgi:ketosteroid isomerase-like protein
VAATVATVGSLWISGMSFDLGTRTRLGSGSRRPLPLSRGTLDSRRIARYCITMSQENVEVVRSLFAAFARRDLEAAARVLHPEVEIRPAIVGGLEKVVYRGLDGNRQFWAGIDAAWTEFRIQPEEFRDLGGEVLVLGRVFARAPGSGIVLNEASAWIAAVRRGQIVRFRSFSNQPEALEASGLSE